MHRSLLNSAIIGTSKGYEKILEQSGVGFRAALKGRQLNLQLGFSHDVNFDIPEGIKITVEKQTTIKISGIKKLIFYIGLALSSLLVVIRIHIQAFFLWMKKFKIFPHGDSGYAD